MGDRSTVMPIAAAAALGRLAARGASFDLVFLDPPYESGDLDAILAAIGPSSLVARGGRIIAEHPSARDVCPTPPLRVIGSRSYGGTALTTLAAEEEDN
jgi:16S rRNA G966 N2-methylase RsmD